MQTSLSFAELVKNSKANQEKMLGRALTEEEMTELEVPPATPFLDTSPPPLRPGGRRASHG